MSLLNQSYKELAIPYFKEVFYIIDEVMLELNIPYYLIGVNAIDLELLKDGVKPSRGTKDIDFALMVSSLEEYNVIIERLEESGFRKVKAPWTLISDKYDVVIDLLPFGNIEQHDTVQFNDRYTDLHVLGFKEVLGSPVEIEIEYKIAQIPSLAGMVLLKLIAWSDRPEERDNDPADILKIIENFYEFEFDDIVENHYDTFVDKDEFDQLKIASRVLGRKAKAFLSQSKTLEKRILSILESNLGRIDESAIAIEWATRKGVIE